MLIKVKNGDIYQRWVIYYEKYYKELIPAERRTMAFIKSSNNEQLPLYVG